MRGLTLSLLHSFMGALSIGLVLLPGSLHSLPSFPSPIGIECPQGNEEESVSEHP